MPLYNKLNPVVETGKELNASLPPKASEADRILKQLLQAIQTGNLNNYLGKTEKAESAKNADKLDDMTFAWQYGSENPTHIWGSKGNPTRMQVWDPKNITVGRATNADEADAVEWGNVTNKPTPADIGALATTGGTITGYTKFETEYIDIGIGEERLIRIGVGPTDMYICNLKTKKYLQLKDTGILSYSNKEICDKGHFVANTGLNGYQMLPSGLCLQWGYVEMGSASTKVINFPKAYVDNNYVFVPGVYGGPGRVPSIKSYYAKNSNISIQSESGFSAYWIAIGRV